MKRLSRMVIVIAVLVAGWLSTRPAEAHPLGNFTINHYTGLQVNRKGINVDYVLDMAEIPAYQEIASFDANHNGQPDPEEVASYHPKKCEAIGSGLTLRLSGKLQTLILTRSQVEFPVGAAGLSTLRLTCAFQAPATIAGSKLAVDYSDNSYTDRLGWREIVVTGDGVVLEGSFATTSKSNRLTAYPTNMLQNPLNERQVSFVALPGAGAASNPSPQGISQASVIPGGRNDPFTRLITLQELTLPTLLLALLIAFVWGALHALTPGHGKTIVAAYLVGSRGTARHAAYLGLTTTITHTLGVFALGLATLLISRFVVTEKLFPWLDLVSGMLVVAIGLGLFVGRFRAARRDRGVGEGHHHSHPGEQPHSHSHAGALAPAHLHRPESPQDSRELTIRVGKLAYAETRSDGEQHYHVAVTGHTHDLLPPHVHAHVHEHDPAGPHLANHLTGHEHTHEHGGATHSHLPPGAQGEKVTLRSLLALGISGGLLPCPSALVVLLSAIALGKVAFGLVLVLVFSLGLASVLTGIGLTFVYAGRLFQRMEGRTRLPLGMRLIGWMPAASALFIALVGAGITAKALVDVGLIRFS